MHRSFTDLAPPTSPPPCRDVIPNCDIYQSDTCTNPDYYMWARYNCFKFCKFCQPGAYKLTIYTHEPIIHGRAVNIPNLMWHVGAGLLGFEEICVTKYH